MNLQICHAPASTSRVNQGVEPWVSQRPLARAFAESGKRAEATGLLNELKARSSGGCHYAAELASVYTALGDKDDAMASLEKGYEERFNPGVLPRPVFDPLRSDPAFQDFERRIGLPR